MPGVRSLSRVADTAMAHLFFARPSETFPGVVATTAAADCEEARAVGLPALARRASSASRGSTAAGGLEEACPQLNELKRFPNEPSLGADDELPSKSSATEAEDLMAAGGAVVADGAACVRWGMGTLAGARTIGPTAAGFAG